MSKVEEKVAEISDALKRDLGEIELRTMEFTLADAIREGAGFTDKAESWGTGETACALSAAVLSARARGYSV